MSHVFEFEFPGGRKFEIEAEPHQEDQALKAAKNLWSQEQTQRTGALQQSSKSEFRPGGFTGADFQNPVQRALNPVIDALHPFTLPQLPKTISDILGYVGGIGERAEQGVSSGVQRVLGGDIAGGIGEGVSAGVGAGAQIPLDLAKGVGSELSQSYESAQQGDLIGGATRAGMTIAPFIKPIASGLRAGVSGAATGASDISTGLSRAGRTASKFADAPNIAAPEITFQRATNMHPDLVPDALDLAAEHAQRTKQAVRNPTQMIQASKADDVLLDNYKEAFMGPQLDLVNPNAHLDIYQRKVAAVPDSLRREDFGLYTRTMRKLQREFENGPLTVRQLEKDRGYLANKGRAGSSGSAAENTLDELIDNAWANGVRDNLYDFLDSQGQNHGSILREIHARKGTNKLIRDDMEKLIPKSTLEAGQSRMDILREVPGQIARATGITGQSSAPAMAINEAMFDAVQRWTPRRGPLPMSPYRPFNTVTVAPTGPPEPLVGSYGAGRAGKPSTGVGYQPFPNQPGQAPPSLVNAPSVSGQTIARAPGVTLPPRAGAPPLVESYMTPTGRAGSPFIGDIDPITGLRITQPPLANTGQVIIPKPKPPY